MRKTLMSLMVATTAISVFVAPSSMAEAKVRSAKEQKAPAIKCKPTKAVGHTPANIAPADKLPKRMPRTLSLETNCGNIVIALAGAKAPITVTQMTTLAKGGYFDNSLCHRLTTQGLFVLQCGDPDRKSVV